MFKNYRRILAIFVVTVMSLSLLAGCSNSKNTGSDNIGSDEVSDENGLSGDDVKDDASDTKSDKDNKNNKDNRQDTNNWNDWSKWTEGGNTPDAGNNQSQTGDSGLVNQGSSDKEGSQFRYDYTMPEVVFSKPNDITDVSMSFYEDGSFEFDDPSTLYSKTLTLTIDAPEGAKVYYTLDGTNPDENSAQADGKLVFNAHGGSFPEAYTLRMIAVLADGTVSKIAARTYLITSKLDSRFSTLIFSVSGNPEELTEGPDGIFYGNNYEDRGRESEREVFVEVWRPDGTNVLSQFAGVRIYGGYSRQSTVKSMKLFSRSSYDPDHKNFKFSEFGTMKLDGSDKIIKKYDKLVLRNYGNDFQFSYIRDELSQTLCKAAGFDCYEAVIPAVCYLNGSYYGLFWLHENYCDKYFKEKFGDAEGEFYVLEGTDITKSDDDDPTAQALVDDFNKKYDYFSKSDLTNDSVYAKLCAFMDVEDYLDFFAWNIALNNWDWPNNNFKCYRYVEADAATLAKTGATVTPSTEYYDGRWRFLVHDMDYTYNLYDQAKAMANYNKLKYVMNENSDVYSPLFTKLMQRKDCRTYFRNKTLEFVNGALSEESIVSAYKALHATRRAELAYLYKYIQQRRRKGDSTMWSEPSHYSGYEQQILNFARDRALYVVKFMDQLLPEITE